MDAPKVPRETMAAVAALSKMISQADQREAFLKAPDEMLRKGGVDAERIRGLVDHLAGLSGDELRLLAETCEKMTEAGLYVEVDGGTVCFF